ncbi:MAG: diaminopimelate epimerase [Alphaproteobacteria bacterium]|nr:diaminopimelate epimerase [Alphaproteobacteria bacterium]
MIHYTLMHGCGNDFIFLEDPSNLLFPSRHVLALHLCDRHKGIGADGLVLINHNKELGTFSMVYINSDGSDGAMCGNAARCAAYYITYFYNIRQRFIINTPVGAISSLVSSKDDVKIDMTNPKDEKEVSLSLPFSQPPFYFINTGVPHLVIMVSNILNIDVHTWGKKLRNDEIFNPDGTNVNFVETRPEINFIRTYERGVEKETLACGTGSIAAALALYRYTNLQPPIIIKTYGGDHLKIDFKEDANKNFYGVTLSGPVEIIASGEVNESWLSDRGLNFHL